MAGGNSTTKFELFFLIFWVLLTIFLLTMVVLRKLRMPILVHGNKNVSILCAFLQLCTFVFLLAALAMDRWSESHFGSSWAALGVARTHDSGGHSAQYDCSDAGDYKTPCNTLRAAGAFTLIFGLIAIVTSFILTIVVCLSLFGVMFADRLKPHVDVMSNVQWICALAMVLIWGISGHDVQRQMFGSSNSFRVGDSWILCLVATFLAIGTSFFYTSGAGETIKGGEMSAPATSMGPPPVHTETAPAQV